jgi:hypothetical protein
MSHHFRHLAEYLAVRVALSLRQAGQIVHPALEGHAYAQEIAIHELAYAGESGARTRCPPCSTVTAKRPPERGVREHADGIHHLQMKLSVPRAWC